MSGLDSDSNARLFINNYQMYSVSYVLYSEIINEESIITGIAELGINKTRHLKVLSLEIEVGPRSKILIFI